MTTMTDIVPMSARLSPMYSQYKSSEGQEQQYQPWSTKPSQTQVTKDPSTNASEPTGCKKYLTLELFMSILVGLVICGIPLAAVASLNVQKNTAGSASNSATSASASSSNLPTQCSSYTANADATRLVTNTYCTGCICDTSPYMNTGWYRFMADAGTQLSPMPASSNACGTLYPAWFNGSLPSTAGSTSTGTVCINYSGSLCYSTWSMSPVSVTNCNGFYVYYLTPMINCNMRYCTVP